jgi:hypothetical protein
MKEGFTQAGAAVYGTPVAPRAAQVAVAHLMAMVRRTPMLCPCICKRYG